MPLLLLIHFCQFSCYLYIFSFCPFLWFIQVNSYYLYFYETFLVNMMFMEWIHMDACICRSFIFPLSQHVMYICLLSKVIVNFGSKEHVFYNAALKAFLVAFMTCSLRFLAVFLKYLNWRRKDGGECPKRYWDFVPSSPFTHIEPSAQEMALNCPVRDLIWIITVGYVWCAMCSVSSFTWIILCNPQNKPNEEVY